ncbi:lamin tail domain-containing protein [Chloroflexi bacterium TSY]|nr:lamin tail domain-containing protein [Chloroflexi bacterium TSY]
MVAQYRKEGLYPTFEPPIFSQHGGSVSEEFVLTIANPNPDTGEIWYTLDGTDPRPPYGNGDPRGIRGGNQTTVAVNRAATGSVVVKARIYSRRTWSALHEASFFPIPPASGATGLSDLRISELMVNPPEGSDMEFVEIQNSGPHHLDIGGVEIRDGIEYTFPAGTRLAPNAFLVLAKFPDRFVAKYGFLPFNQKPYLGRLSNEEETILLRDAAGNELSRYTYNLTQPGLIGAHRLGFSLIPTWEEVQLGADAPAVSDNQTWRISTEWSGSPQRANAAPNLAIGHVLINEIGLASQPAKNNFVELYNASNAPTNIGGWFLTNEREQPQKYRFPNDTWIAPYGFLVVPASQLGFPLHADAQGVYLLSANSTGNLTGYGHGYALDEVWPSAVYGRCILADAPDREHFVALNHHTPGLDNAYPQIGPLVISEIMYNPDGEDEVGGEFIELMNLSRQAVPLYDPANPTNRWRIRGVGDYRLPHNLTLSPNATMLVVATDPEEFRQVHRVSGDVLVVGPYSGKLSNSGERLTLERPTTPSQTGDFRYVAVDEVHYDDNGLWAQHADGDGWSLERVRLDGFGDAAENWRRSEDRGGSPGVLGEAQLRERGVVAGTANVFTQLEQSAVWNTSIYLPIVMDMRPRPQANYCIRN